MEEIKEMPFGKKVRVGNFEYIKITKSLSRREVMTLRNEAKIPSEVQRHLRRGGLPYIMVNTISGSWSICFVCGCLMYNLIESNYFRGEDGTKALTSLFLMMYSDTAVVGDAEYWRDKGEAFRAFMNRRKADEVSKEDNDKELEALRVEEEAKAAIVEMAKEVEDGK